MTKLAQVGLGASDDSASDSSDDDVTDAKNAKPSGKGNRTHSALTRQKKGDKE